MPDDDPLPPTTWLRMPTPERPAPPSPRPPSGAAGAAPATPVRRPQGGAGTFSGGQVDPATTHLRRETQRSMVWAGALAAIMLAGLALAALLPVLYLMLRG